MLGACQDNDQTHDIDSELGGSGNTGGSDNTEGDGNISDAHDPVSGAQRLSQNIVSVYHAQKNDADMVGNRTKLFDFADQAYSKYADTTYVKDGTKGYRISYAERNSWLFTNFERNWSAYQAFSFWVYAPPGTVGQTFAVTMISPKADELEACQNSLADSCASNYYSTIFTIEKEGWTLYNKPFSEFNITREPSGWDHIHALVINSTGYGQTNDTSTTIYLNNFYLYSDASDLNYSSHLPELNGAFFAENAPRSIIQNKLIKNAFHNDDAKTYIKDGVYWIPLSTIAARYDDDATFDEATKTLKFKLNQKQYIFVGDTQEATIDGVKTPLEFTIASKNNALFFPHTYIRDLLGYTKEYRDEMGMLVLHNDNPEFSALSQRLAVMYEMLFVRPTGAQILSDMKTHLGGDVHPRVTMRQADFDRLRELLKTDTTLQEYKRRMEFSFGTSSANFIGAPVKYERSDGIRLLPVSRVIKSRLIIWSLLYKLTVDKAYVDRIWTEMQAVFAFPDWNPSHDIDTAEIIYPVSIAYDWLYDAWTAEQRKAIENAITKFGFPFALDVFAGKSKMWPDNNHTNVINGALTAASLAFANVPDMRASCETLLGNAITNVERSFFTYAPDGGYIEGPGYWSYGTEFQIVMLSALETATGTDYNLFETPGFKESVYHPLDMESDAGIWQLHDTSNVFTDTQFLRWFARKVNDPSLTRLRLREIREKHKAVFFHDLLWYDPVDENEPVELPLDSFYKQVGVTTSRSSWDAGAIFTGLHGGENYKNRLDLDIGTFILYASGKRFFIDLSPEDYNMWGDGNRFLFYRKRAEGQNTLVIGDVDYKVTDQVEQCLSTFLRREDSPKSAIAVVDMAPAYTAVTTGKRGLFFTDNRKTVIIQDEISLSSPEIVRWGAHVPDTVSVTLHNGNRAVDMVDGEARLYCEIVSDNASLTFSYGDAVSYDPNYPKTPGEHYNHNAKDDYIDAYNIKALRIITPQKVLSFNLAVVCHPLSITDAVPSLGRLYTFTSINDWKLQ